jgi:hypothetical protein
MAVCKGKSDMSNYRPMSCVNGLSELSEEVVFKELVNHFHLNTIGLMTNMA